MGRPTAAAARIRRLLPPEGLQGDERPPLVALGLYYPVRERQPLIAFVIMVEPHTVPGMLIRNSGQLGSLLQLGQYF